jgi:hypothetical protein
MGDSAGGHSVRFPFIELWLTSQLSRISSHVLYQDPAKYV